MQAEELRALSVDQLVEKEAELRASLGKLSMQRYARRLDRTSDLEVAKRDLARLLTVLGEKRRAASKGGSHGGA